jgi:hypothetical protein
MSENEAISSIIPPLISNSPPPEPTSPNNSPSASIVDDDLPNLYDSIQKEPVRSLNDPSPLGLDTNDSFDLPQVPSHQVDLEDAKINSIENIPIQISNFTDWDPFNVQTNTKESNIESNAGDWANFVATESNFQSFVNTTDKNSSENTDLNKEQEKENQMQAVITNASIDDDDEFSEFVDNSDIQSEEIQTQPPTASAVELPKPILSENVAPSPLTTIPEPVLDLVGIAEKVFSNFDSFFKPDATHVSAEFDDCLDVKSNDTWLQLKTYTSINDASISLKFKWYLSNVESFYLESLNLERAAIPIKVGNILSNFFIVHLNLNLI